MARHPEGLELVRIGRPLRPEFAAWRYGDQFGRRRRRSLAYFAGISAVGVATVVGNLAGVAGLSLLGAAGHFYWFEILRTKVRLQTDGNRKIKLKLVNLQKIRIFDDDGPDGPGFKLQIQEGKKKTWHEGAEAWRFAGKILPHLNAAGGSRKKVNTAVALIEDRGHPERFLADLAGGAGLGYARHAGVLAKMPNPTRLALEMALHEEQERRALEGELWLLEKAWKEAEEMAAISDDMFLPEGTEDFLAKHRTPDSG